MRIVDFLARAPRKDLWQMGLLTAVAGLSNALLVVVINKVAASVARGQQPGEWPAVTFVSAFGVYFLCNRKAMLTANTTIERLLKGLRTDIADQLRQSSLTAVDRMGRGTLISILAKETNHLSVTFPILIETVQQALLLLASTVYLGTLSIPALLMFLAAVAIGIAGHIRVDRSFRATQEQIAVTQAALLDAIRDLIHGSKELRLHRAKSDAVYAAYRKLSRWAERLFTQSAGHWSSQIVVGSFIMYNMLALVVFVYPKYFETGGASLMPFRLVPVLLFCIGALSRIVAQSPMFVRAEMGLQAIFTVEQKLAAGRGATTAEARQHAERFQDFQEIEYTGIRYPYRDAAGEAVFQSGPWNLKLTRGEMVFLVGGNGSGKSTALRLLTGLYEPEEGQITVDGKIVAPAEIAGLREQFSAIFGDFHLFDRLYGMEDAQPDEVNALIADMGLGKKVRYANGRFTDLHLSTGQRKRLALITALLEDRPIYVFDEWSAEQDVHFREEFYTRVLPSLKAKGKTVVAATHDERFWHLADRVVKMDLGCIVWERAGSDPRGVV
jgi:putative ATP-binding cassette transporter